MQRLRLQPVQAQTPLHRLEYHSTAALQLLLLRLLLHLLLLAMRPLTDWQVTQPMAVAFCTPSPPSPELLLPQPPLEVLFLTQLLLRQRILLLKPLTRLLLRGLLMRRQDHHHRHPQLLLGRHPPHRQAQLLGAFYRGCGLRPARAPVARLTAMQLLLQALMLLLQV